MATAIIDWVPTNGSSYEIWYAKLSTVGSTSMPPATGWTQAPGSPFDSTLGTASITGLDDNTQYRVDSRADCTSNDSAWINNIKYKLVCPSLSLVTNPVSTTDAGATITATVTLENYIEFGSIASTVTLIIKKTSDGSTVDSVVFGAPYASATLTHIFSGLLVTTGYTVYMTMNDNIASSPVTCSNQSATTQTPVVVPPPTCTAPTFTLSNITISSVAVNITSSINSGDTFDVSLNGGSTYTSLGNTTTPIVVTGLTSNTAYQVVVRRNCVGGGIGISTSQTFTTSAAVVVGTLAMNSNMNAVGSFANGTLYITFTFPQATPFPITLYFGYIHENGCSSCAGGKCSWSNGYDIFTPPSGAQNCPGSPTGDPYAGSPNLPFIVNVPQGVTTYNSGTNIRTAYTGPVTGPWQNVGAGSGGARGYTDLYVKVASPSGYSASFTITNGTNITGVTLHNV